MTSINSSLYTTLNGYTGLSGLAGTESVSESDTAVQSQETAADTVSLSSAVSTAQAREYFGLAPTGKLTFSDIESAAQAQETAVNETLAAAMEELGIPADQQISLSLDDEGAIAIEETFDGKDDLEAYLNQDEDFLQAFSGLSTNSEVLDYTRSLGSTSFSLADYLGGSDSDLLSLAQQYSAFKSASSIETLWQISHNKAPFSYTYGESE